MLRDGNFGRAEDRREDCEYQMRRGQASMPRPEPGQGSSGCINRWGSSKLFSRSPVRQLTQNFDIWPAVELSCP